VIFIAAILFAAILHGGNGLQAAILVPLWLCLAAVVIIAIARGDGKIVFRPSPFLPAFSARPPPAR
jgi:hypothetical protein